MSVAEETRTNVQMTGPYDSFRDFIAALEARGRLIRIKEMDQDQFEATSFAYKLIEKYGYYEAPGFVIERIKIDGKWVEGPLFGNMYGAWDVDAMIFGVENVTNNYNAMYHAAIDKLKSKADRNGAWPLVPPTTTDAKNAPVKEVVITGKDVDITKFPWLHNNPADVGRYLNMGAVIIDDPELGRNVGTYRCQIKDKTKIGVNPEIGQDAWRMLMTARRQGRKTVPVAIALGVDPITFCFSATKACGPRQDELGLAGGMRGSPVELVKCETSDIMVPANAELIVEGEVPVGEDEPEGPYGEMYGYIGLEKPQNFFMNIKAITHRHKPWFPNDFTGAVRGAVMAPVDAMGFLRFKKMIYNLVALHTPTDAVGFIIISIDKTQPGDGITAGLQVAGNLNIAKITVVVDKDVDVYNFQEVMSAVGSRWQPHPASVIIEQTKGMRLDPSTRNRGMGSNIVIDATRQFPEEGGPDAYPPVNLTALTDGAPDAMKLVESKWDEYLKDWQG